MKIFFAAAIIIAGVGGLLFYAHPQVPLSVRVTATPLATSSPRLTPAPGLTLHTVGQITRHASNFTGQRVRVQGYMLVAGKDYVIFSDETGGAISSFDLPVTGPGIDTLIFKQKYELQGTFVYGGLNASNHNLYHLELSQPPQPIQ